MVHIKATITGTYGAAIDNYLVLYCIVYKMGVDKHQCFQIAEKALLLSPESPKVLVNISLAYYELGKKEEGLLYLEKAAQIDPNNSSIHSNLSNVYFQLKKLDKAFYEAKEAYRTNPSLRNAYIIYLVYINQNSLTSKFLRILHPILVLFVFFVSTFSAFIWHQRYLLIFPIIYLLLMFVKGIKLTYKNKLLNGITEIILALILLSFLIYILLL